MAPGGLLLFNTTGSGDALKTATSIFPHAYLYDNFAICGDFDWRTKLDEAESVDELLMIRPSGTPLFTEADRPLILDFLSRYRTATAKEIATKIGRPLEMVTDRNVITEYKYGVLIYGERRLLALFNRWLADLGDAVRPR
jgi:hypothetical protein